jgi:hypothetical protein
MKYFLLFLVFLFYLITVKAQTNSSFRFPLDIPPDISGNFGQLRSSHYHAGLDFRTQQITGLPVYACADGFIKRLRIGYSGYGKVVYLEHDNGLTTVYAHLENFWGLTDSLCRMIQFKTGDFMFDTLPVPGQFNIRKGEIIGFSGNTGSSRGPHLHFEVRKSDTQEALNPLAYGFNVSDNQAPVFTGFKIYREDLTTHINGQPTDKEFNLEYKEGSFRIRKNHSIQIRGSVSLSVEVYDRFDASTFKNGIYSLECYINDSLTFRIKFDKFTFEESKRINVHCDYEDRIRLDRDYEKLSILPNDNTQVYDFGLGKGILNCKAGESYKAKIRACDYSGNCAYLNILLKGETQNDPFVLAVKDTTKIVHYDEEFTYQTEGVRINLPRDAVFNPLELNVVRLKSGKLPAHQIGSKYIPLKKSGEVCIERPRGLEIRPSSFFIVNEGSWLPVRVDGNYLCTALNAFGEVQLNVDTISPFLQPINVRGDKNLGDERTIRIQLRDNQSGIKSWKAFLDDEVYLMEYEQKENLLFGRVPGLNNGWHELKIEVWDKAMNSSVLKQRFYYDIPVKEP